MHRVELRWQYVWLFKGRCPWCRQDLKKPDVTGQQPLGWHDHVSQLLQLEARKKLLSIAAFALTKFNWKPLVTLNSSWAFWARASPASLKVTGCDIYTYSDRFAQSSFRIRSTLRVNWKSELALQSWSQLVEIITTWTFHEWSKQSCCQRGKNEAQECR